MTERVSGLGYRPLLVMLAGLDVPDDFTGVCVLVRLDLVELVHAALQGRVTSSMFWQIDLVFCEVDLAVVGAAASAVASAVAAGKVDVDGDGDVSSCGRLLLGRSHT